MTSLGLLLGVALVGLGAFLYERSRRNTHPVAAGRCESRLLPYQRDFELYHNDFSLCSKKARLCLAELGIQARLHPVDLIETGRYENLSRNFLQVNPAGLVPVLVHRGHPIYESHEQIRYAAQNAASGAPQLIPETEEARAEMERWIEKASVTGDDPIAAAHQSAGNAVPGLTVPLFASMIAEIPTWRILEGLLFHRLKSRPALFLMMKVAGFRGLRDGSPARKLIARCGRALHGHLDDLEVQLDQSGGPWILGNTFSLADVSWAVILERLREADSLPVFLSPDSRPCVTAWWRKLQERPSYASAIEAHRHPTTQRGLERLRAAKQRDPRLREALEKF